MGGKQNRTKNNVKPSSSGRSAAMLHSSLPQFGGFSGTNKPSNLSSFAFNLVDEFDSSIDDRFQLVLKKVSKKDCTTKLKGLQEFAELLQKLELDSVKTLLPSWPRFYSVLVIHPDNRVREATQNVHHIIVLKAKREIAPYLKELMPSWYTSQFDNYPPAAAAAIQAFKDTFSQAKFKDAVNFCHEQILNYIHDNLLIEPSQYVASNQFSPEESEARYERIVISCLQGYSMYLKEVSEEKRMEATSLSVQVVSNKKFWKLGTSKIPLVRSAWFQVISAILQKALHLLKNRETQVLTIILNNLKDDEPAALLHTWECLLLATSIADWWKHINMEQRFIPIISNILEQGGSGSAAIIYPNLLPLLSNLSAVKGKNMKSFYIDFFGKMCCGIRLKHITSNNQESKAISVAYMECLQFLIAQNMSDPLLSKKLIKELCILIEWCLSKEAISYKTTFNGFPKFFLYLKRNDRMEETKNLLEYLFDSLNEIFCRTLKSTEEVSVIARKQIEFILILKEINLVGDKQQIHSNNNQIVQEFVMKIIEMYLNYIDQTSSNDLVEPLFMLIHGFDNRVIFDSLLNKLNADIAKPVHIDIYKRWFKNWLLSANLYCRSVLDLIFQLLPNLEDQEKKVVLNDLLKANHPNCVIWSVGRALSVPHANDRVVQNWLRGKEIGDLFVSIAKMYCANECNEELADIFKSALKQSSHGGFLIERSVLERIIADLSLILYNRKEENISKDSSCSLAVHICSEIYTESSQLLDRDELLLALFNVLCQFPDENNLISAEKRLEINSVCRRSLSILLKNLNDSNSQSLLTHLIELIQENFKFILINRRRGHIDNLNQVITEVVDTVFKSRPNLLTWLVEFLSEKSRIVRATIIDLCKMAEYIKGTLTSPYEEITVPESVSEAQMICYFLYNFIEIQVLSIVISNLQFDVKEESEVERSDSDNSRISNFCRSSAHNLLEVVYSYTIIDTFLTHFNNINYYNEVHHYHVLFEEIIYDLFKAINKDALTELKNLFRYNSLTNGWFWCKATYVFYTKFLNAEDLFSVYKELLQNIVETESIGILHLKQIFKEYNQEHNSHDSTEELCDKAAILFKDVDDFRKENLPEFLYDQCDMTWQRTNRVIKAIKQCTLLMETQLLTQKYWDIIVLSLVSWISNCLKAKRLVKEYQYQCMLVSTSELYMATCTTIAKLKKEQGHSSYVSEWEDVLHEGIHVNITQIWFFLADYFSKSTEDPLLNLPFLQTFGKVTDCINSNLIFKGSDNLPKWSKFLKICSSSLLTNSQTILQIWGYKMLLVLVPDLAKIDYEAVSTTTPHSKGLIFEQLKEKLLEIQDIVNSVLIDFRIGENSCKVEPFYDSFTYIFAYLLLWDVILSLCEIAPAELRYQYSDWLKNDSLLHQLLPNFFKLMPTEVLHHDEARIKSSADIFLNNPMDVYCYSKFCGSDMIENLACYLYKYSLEQFPALVRQWWSVLDIKISQMVEKTTILYVSPHICNMELNSVVQHQNIFKNLKVKVMPSVREIQAVYTVDETQMELTITLPSNYPLGSPNIICNRQISGTSQKQWLLQFKKCVLHQNGKIWDGLSLWNSNLDRKFDGVEECYICYAILHSGTYQLPKLSCRTCKKKFHSACLYKWFSTSNNSSCPICRNLF